jgi:hypothetical protein
MNSISRGPQLSNPEEALEPLFAKLVEQISGKEGADSVISYVQTSVIDCINAARGAIGKEPLELGALETAYLMTGHGDSVFDGEDGNEIGNLETVDGGPTQRFVITDSEALKDSILKKVKK